MKQSNESIPKVWTEKPIFTFYRCSQLSRELLSYEEIFMKSATALHQFYAL
jgi:hypothetical protein